MAKGKSPLFLALGNYQEASSLYLMPFFFFLFFSSFFFFFSFLGGGGLGVTGERM